MPDFHLDIDLILRGPVLTHSTAIGAVGISSPFARNSRGMHYLPGTLIKGRLRQSWTELHFAAGAAFQPDVAGLLGESSSLTAPASYSPMRGTLNFEDFIDKTSKTGEDKTRYRISVDPKQGAVKRGFYQVLEAPYATGEFVTFSGAVHFSAATQDCATKIRHDIEVGLRWITSFGAERSIGFGRLIDVNVGPLLETILTTKKSAATGADSVSIVLSPQSPFCLARRRIDPNFFESDATIPGSALKGSLASSWLALLGKSPNGPIKADTDPTRPQLCLHFDKVRFTHAFPALRSQQSRPVTAPMSIVKAGRKIYDVAKSEGPILLADESDDLIAPEFAVDWKSNLDIQQEFGWACPDTELRVRTAIDANRRKAKDEQLFAYEKILPHETDSNDIKREVEWHCNLELGAIPKADRMLVESQLRELLSLGLRSVGKTKTHVSVDVRSQATSAKHPSKPSMRDGLWIITLQTSALLCEQSAILASDLFGAYQQVLTQISEGSLQLVRFFARQSLAGGSYLWNRFQPGKEYTPWLLTDPGSVFVLKATPGFETNAQEHIDKWLAGGLPLPQWATLRYGNHWSSCPFLPECGYGEIAVNLDIHWAKHPSKGEFHVI